jgi:hypothetical protein
MTEGEWSYVGGLRGDLGRAEERMHELDDGH